ncbi:MAG: NAD(+) synthase [Sphingomonadaceae bacterium]
MADLDSLLARIEAYVARSGAARSTVSRKLFGNGKRLDEIAAGGSLTARKLAEAGEKLAALEAGLGPAARASRARHFRSIHAHGLVRCAAATPAVHTADPPRNAEAVIALAKEADANSVDLLVFPELCLSSYAIDDLHMQQALLEACEEAVAHVARASAGLSPLILVGAPLRRDGRIYNCAVAISRGAILGAVPKIHLPNYREYYEKRWFASGAGIAGAEIGIAGEAVPFGADLLFAASDLAGFIVHAEICEDFWATVPPSCAGALAGATILANLSASNITIGKAAERRMLSASQSARAVAAYIYSAAGPGESTTDLAWDGQGDIYELGELIAESDRFPREPQMVIADVDTGRILSERMRMGTFEDSDIAAGRPAARFRRIAFEHRPALGDIGLHRPIRRFPFVPNRPEKLDEDCYEAFNIQVEGLARRYRATPGDKMILGVSGGLDSTHALIVAAKACDRMGIGRDHVLGVTMPGFATGEATKANAHALMEALGVAAEEIDIRPAAKRMLADIGHPFAEGKKLYDIAFENVQAGLRTDYLFRLANSRGGFVIGTGDLSELALGWMTYGVGDQMSHYAVNAGVPKTLIQYLIRWCVRTGQFEEETGDILARILGTVITPELIPAGDDTDVQSTEEKIGPYALHDFFLHHIARYGQPPSKVAFLALHAWGEKDKGLWPLDFPDEAKREYDLAEIGKWLKIFLKRFFATSQFKRSAMPNGPKVSSGGALSPRGDWRAPSDASADVWLEELKRNVPKG